MIVQQCLLLIFSHNLLCWEAQAKSITIFKQKQQEEKCNFINKKYEHENSQLTLQHWKMNPKIWSNYENVWLEKWMAPL